MKTWTQILNPSHSFRNGNNLITLSSTELYLDQSSTSQYWREEEKDPQIWLYLCSEGMEIHLVIKMKQPPINASQTFLSFAGTYFPSQLPIYNFFHNLMKFLSLSNGSTLGQETADVGNGNRYWKKGS